MNTSTKSLIVTLTFSLSYMTSYCPTLQQSNTAEQRQDAVARRQAKKTYARIEQNVRNKWVDHLPEKEIKVLIAAAQNNFALQEATRLLPVVPTAVVHNAISTQQAAINVVNRVLGTNPQPVSEESKTA